MNQSYYSENLQSRIQRILEAKTKKLSELAQIAGLSLKTDYIGVDLSGEDLSNDKLENANLSSANLSNTILDNTVLTNVDFRNTNLRGATLINADLSLANLKGAIIDESTDIDNKWRLVWNIVNRIDLPRYLDNKDLSFANLNFADLQKIHLEKTIFKGASLQEANLSSAALEGANFENADLRKANLTRITFDEYTSFRNANVFQARFGGTFGFPPKLKEYLINRKAIFEEDISIDVFEQQPEYIWGRAAVTGRTLILKRETELEEDTGVETEMD